MLEFTASTKSRRNGPKLTPAQRAQVRKAAGKKAAQTRRNTKVKVKLNGKVVELTASQVAGYKAAAARAAKAQKNS